VVLAVLLTGCSGLVEVRATGDITLPPPAQTSRVLAADGTLLAGLHAEEDREVVPLARVPRVLVDAVLAAEDARFHLHGGVDARAIARAARRNVQEGRVAEGGSTITQQLAKHTVTGDERTFRRKIAEAVVAVQIEQRHDKDDILQRYLNLVPLGNGTYGVATASRRYFGVEVDALTLPQAALLAGMIRAPARYDPHRYPQAATARRGVVLGRLVTLGWLDAAAAAEAAAAPLGVVPPPPDGRSAPWFVDHVLERLQHDPAFAALGADPTARADRLYRGGLVIETTLDPDWQAAAEAALARTLPDPAGPRAALVAIHPATGEVRALVGGRDDDAADPWGRFNLAVDGRRQPGSAFKPLVLATALAQGHRLDEVFPGGASVAIGDWTVGNFEDADPGPVTLERATALSVNTVYARLIHEVGPEAVARTAAALGVRRPLAPLPSLALGAQEVSALELASVQATLAAGGEYHAPSVVRRIVGPDGAVLYDRGEVPGERVLDTEVAAEVTRALRGVIQRGTGAGADILRPLAGKTGTTQDLADAWFAGYTPDLAAAVWVGFPEGRVPMVPPRTRIPVLGGTWPAEAFARFGVQALAQVPAADFPAPAGGTGSGEAGSAPTAPAVPSVVGLPADRAREQLAAAGWEVEVVGVPDPRLPPGYVVAQDVVATGTGDGQAGRAVRLVVSRGTAG